MKPIEELREALEIASRGGQGCNGPRAVLHDALDELARLRGAEERMRERAAQVVIADAKATCSPSPKTLLAEIRALPLTTDVTTETKESGR